MFEPSELAKHYRQNVQVETMVESAIRQLRDNQETFVAKWFLDNPDKNAADYVMCYQPDFNSNGKYYKFWMQEKRYSGEYVTVDKDEFIKLVTLVMETSEDEETFKVAKQLMFKHLGN